MSGCYECAWGKVAGCWKCGQRMAIGAGVPEPRMEASGAGPSAPTESPEASDDQPASDAVVSGLSWSGHNISGDRASIATVTAALHDAATVPELKQRIREAEYEVKKARDETRWERTRHLNFVLDLGRVLRGEPTICDFPEVEEVRVVMGDVGRVASLEASEASHEAQPDVPKAASLAPSAEALPPLPATSQARIDGRWMDYYTADQMRTYALSAIESARAAEAPRLAEEDIASIVFDTIRYDGGLQMVNESDLTRLCRAIESAIRPSADAGAAGVPQKQQDETGHQE